MRTNVASPLSIFQQSSEVLLLKQEIMSQGSFFSSSNICLLKQFLPQRNLNTISQERTIFCEAFQTLALPVCVSFFWIHMADDYTREPISPQPRALPKNNSQEPSWSLHWQFPCMLSLQHWTYNLQCVFFSSQTVSFHKIGIQPVGLSFQCLTTSHKQQVLNQHLLNHACSAPISYRPCKLLLHCSHYQKSLLLILPTNIKF